MQDAGDIVTVTGDLILQSTSEEHRVSRGVFNLRGDIYQYETATGAGSFKTGSDCNFILTSPNAHVLSFEDAVNNHIGWLTFNNHVSAPKSLSIGRVDMNGYNLTVAGNLTTTGQVSLQDFDPAPPVYTPSGDLTLSGDMTIESDTLYKGMNLGGYSLTVNGDMRCTSDIDLNCGTLTIKGTLYHESGEIYVHGGKLIITGNYYIAGSDSNFTPGNQTFTSTWGRLVMEHEADEVHIGGSFLTASYYSSKSYTFLTNGTMYIAGNFRHALGDQYGFNATDNHRVVFNGSAPQSIQFASTGSGFANVEFVNPDIILKGEYLRGFTLQNDINLTLEDVSADDMYFHARFSDLPENPLEEDVEILSLQQSCGRFLGTNIAVIPNTELYGDIWWGEGAVKIWLDGDTCLPTLVGTGSEDYVGSAWELGEFCNRFQGCVTRIGNAVSMYRFHVKDPIFFRSDIRVTLQTMGGGMWEKVQKLRERNAPHTYASYDSNGTLHQIYRSEEPVEPEGYVNFFRRDHYRTVAYFDKK